MIVGEETMEGMEGGKTQFCKEGTRVKKKGTRVMAWLF
jgi:hypothetical protein